MLPPVPDEPEMPPREPEPVRSPVEALRGRIRRLLDRKVGRLAEELDLAEAICALKWPKWPAYRGPIDLWHLRQALEGIEIDASTLNWLGSRELEKACRQTRPA